MEVAGGHHFPNRAAPLLAFVIAVFTGLAAVAPAAVADASYQLDRRNGKDVVISDTMREYTQRNKEWAEEPYLSVIPGSSSGVDKANSMTILLRRLGIGGVDVHVTNAEGLDAGDLDGDGDGDLVVTAQEYDPSGYRFPIVVIPGRSGGPHVDSAYLLSERTAPEWAEASQIIMGDLDRDGFSDLLELQDLDPDLNGHREAWAIVYWGGPTRLTAERSTRKALFLDQTHPQPFRVAFGNVVGGAGVEIVGLSSGYAGNMSDTKEERGAVRLCPVTAQRTIRCASPRPTRGGRAEMVVGDTVGDAHDDVMISHPDYSGANINWMDEQRFGAVWVHRGGAETLSTWERLWQSSRGVPGSTEKYDRFGSAMAVGDIDGDGKDELAVGAAGEDDRSGRVTVLYGNRAGLGRSSRDMVIDQATPGVAGSEEAGDAFGARVSLIDVDSNGRLDLVASATGEDLGRGSVTVIEANQDGRLVGRRSTVIRPQEIGVPRNPNFTGTGRRFGGFGTLLGQ